MAIRTGKFTIYALTEQDGTVRYVGRSQDVTERFLDLIQRTSSVVRRHIWNRLDAWIHGLLEQQQLPKLLILEEGITSLDEAMEREDYWIDFYNKKDGLIHWYLGCEESEVGA